MDHRIIMHPNDLSPEAAAVLKEVSKHAREMVDEGADMTKVIVLLDQRRYWALYRGSTERDSVQGQLEIWVNGMDRAAPVAMTRAYPEGCCQVVPSDRVAQTDRGLVVIG